MNEFSSALECKCSVVHPSVHFRICESSRSMTVETGTVYICACAATKCIAPQHKGKTFLLQCNREEDSADSGGILQKEIKILFILLTLDKVIASHCILYSICIYMLGASIYADTQANHKAVTVINSRALQRKLAPDF